MAGQYPPAGVLLKDLNDLVHWKPVGCFLNISFSDIRCIEADTGSCCDAKSRMLDQWRKSSASPTLEDLVVALYAAGEDEIAEKMETKYGLKIANELPKREFIEIQKILDCSRNLHGHIPRKYAVKVLKDALSEFYLKFPPKFPYQWPEEDYLHYCEPTFYQESDPQFPLLHKGEHNQTSGITLSELTLCLSTSTPVVIKGLAGSGKTHLAHKVALLWAQGNLLKQFSLLLLLSLDSIPVHHQKSLHKLIQFFFPAGKESRLPLEIADEVIKMAGERVLVIVDGWDGRDEEGCLVSQIVRKKLLPSASVLIMCRVGVHPALDRCHYRTFSLGRLNLHQIISSHEHVLCTQSILLLKAFSELHSICEIPYFLNCLLFICRTTSDLCPTLSTLLQLLFNCFITQCSKRLHLSPETLTEFLCKAATRISNSEGWKITASEMEQLCNDHQLQVHIVESIGVFVTSMEGNFPVWTTFYRFLPSSLRVFLHAKQVAGDEHYCLTSEADSTTFSRVLYGCKGLNAAGEVLFDNIDPQNPERVLSVMQCIFEAQSTRFATRFASLLHHRIDFSHTHLSLGDCFALVYMITHSGGDRSAKWKVSLRQCSLSDEHITALFSLKIFPPLTSNRRLADCLDTLDLSNNHIGDVAVECICCEILDGSSLSSLSLQGNQITAKGIAELDKVRSYIQGLTHLSY